MLDDRVGQPASPLEVAASSQRVLTSPALWWHAISAALRSVRRQTSAFVLGFSAVLLVVIMVALLVSITSEAPLVFLRLAELSRGELDAEIRAGDWTGYGFVNYTLLSNALTVPPLSDAYAHHAARFFYEPALVRAADCHDATVRAALELRANSSVQGGDEVARACGYVLEEAESALVIGAMSAREKAMGLGQDWPLAPLAPGELYLHARMARVLNVRPGDTIVLAVDVALVVGRRDWEHIAGVSLHAATPRVFVPMRVAALYSDPHGKHAADAWRVAMVEFDAWWPYVARFLTASHVAEERKAAVAALRVHDYADALLVNLPAPRRAAYLSSTFSRVQGAVLSWASPMFYTLGFTRLLTRLPVLEALETSKYAGLFLGLVLNLVVAVLLVLAVLLLHALLLVNVDTRHFELAVLRMLGARRSALVLLLLAHALVLYALPGTIVGLALAEAGAVGVASALSSLLSVDVAAAVTVEARIIAAALGLLAPTIASLLPIRAALSHDLAAALRARAQPRTAAIQVHLERADGSGTALSARVTLVGAAVAVFGAAIYYVLPLALLSLNLALLANVFLALLLALLLGLTMLALNLQRLLERALVALLLWWESRAVRSLVLKNLTAHRARNTQTAVLYALALGFVLFVSVAYDLQRQSFEYRLQQQNGAYVVVTAGYFQQAQRAEGRDAHLASLAPRLYALEEVARTHADVVASCAWLTHDVEDALLNAKSGSVQLTNLGALWRRTQDIFASSPSLLRVALAQFLRVDSAAVDDGALVDALYTREGRSGALVGSLYRNDLGLSLDEDALFTATLRDERTEAETGRVHRIRPLAFLDAAPALQFSPFPAIQLQSALVSLPMYMLLTDGRYESVEELPLRAFLLRIKNLQDKVRVDALIAALENALEDLPDASVWDYRSATAPLEKSSRVLAGVFSATTVVAMAMCFFSLTSSMVANVHEQAREIAVLRALGLSRGALYRLYVYEAFVLVLAASLLGCTIGLVVSYSMTAQQILFTQLPVPFAFPWPVLLAVVAASALFAFGASFVPIYRLAQLKVVQIFRLVS